MWEIEKIVSKGEYNYAIVREHPNATKNGYVLEHRIVVENQLNRILDKYEVVHHRNGNKKDNRIENLEIMTNREHVEHHALERTKQYVELRCPSCFSLFVKEKRDTHLSKGKTWTSCSNSCRGKFSRKIQLYGLTHEVEVAISGNIVRQFLAYRHDNPEETQDDGVP